MFDLLPNHNELADYWTNNDPFFGDDFFNLALNEPFRMDVQEDDKNYLIEAEMPGIKKKNISVDFKEDVLTIEVDQKEKENKHHFLHRERPTCLMSRGVYLKDANPEGIEAKLEHGLLKINVPKTYLTKPTHLIEVK